MILTHGANSLSRGGGGQTANIGGREYRIVEMPDGKIWLAQNLDYKFDGCGIGGTSYPTTPHAWYYNNDEATYGLDGTYKCGLLYNNYAFAYLEANKATLIPGWRVALAADWETLRAAISSPPRYSTAGTVLKATDGSVASGFPSGWNGTDDYGLNIVPAGLNGMPFENFGSRAAYWKAPNASNAFYFYTGTDIQEGGYDRRYGLSIRLIKDAT